MGGPSCPLALPLRVGRPPALPAALASVPRRPSLTRASPRTAKTPRPQTNQQWEWSPETNSIMSLDGGGQCLQAGYPDEVADAGWMGRLITTGPCDPANVHQQFDFNTDPLNNFAGYIKHIASGFCIDAGHLAQTITYNPVNGQWRRNPARANACPDAGSPPFLPRTYNEDYTVGYYRVGGDIVLERLVILDGDSQCVRLLPAPTPTCTKLTLPPAPPPPPFRRDNNIWTSDDCGQTWDCYDGPNPWSVHGKALTPMLQVPRLGGFTDSPLLSLGGLYYDGALNPARDAYFSPTGVAEGTGDGINWQQMADLPGSAPLYSPGQLAADDGTVYLFGDATWTPPNSVWALSPDNFPSEGFQQLPEANSTGSYGRKVWLHGASSGGCWFSTDFTAGDVWGPNPPPGLTSSNAFSIATSALGPWRQGPTPPWAPRVAVGLTASYDGSKAYLVGGLDYADGMRTGLGFNDAWAIDASVCLYGANGAVCSGHGTADLDTVTCECDPKWEGGNGDCSACSPGSAYGPNCALCPLSLEGGFCNAERGWGVCDSVEGCVCESPHVGTDCSSCPAGQYGVDCATCAACVHGTCDGGGTSGGTGACVCANGWSGPSCSIPVPTTNTATHTAKAAPSPGPSGGGGSSAAGTPAMPPGATGALVFFGLVLGGAGGLWVFATYFGGGPVLAAAWAKARALLPGGGNAERTSLLSQAAARGAGGGLSPRTGALSSAAAEGRLKGASAPPMPSIFVANGGVSSKGFQSI